MQQKRYCRWTLSQFNIYECAHNAHWACMHTNYPLKFHFILFTHFIRSSCEWWMKLRIDRPSLTDLAHKMQTSLTKPNQTIAVNCINNDITTRTSNGIRLQSPILNTMHSADFCYSVILISSCDSQRWSECIFIRIAKNLLSLFRFVLFCSS